MKTLTLTIFAVLLAQFSFSQVEISLEGDMNDSTFLAQVEKMRAKGFSVKVNEPDPIVVKHTDNKLPFFELTDLSGEKISSSELEGKKIHINIWSTTCKPCIEEFPELNQLKKDYENQDYIFIGMAPESEKKIGKLLAKRPLDYIIIPNAQDYLDELGVEAFPVNFFVNEKGIIKKVIHGANYKMEIINGKQKMIPDNYENY
ncbi:MAG: TlpA disulfide reductase family protein, partial [Cyclobacteriaceae bacterium]